MRLEQSRGSFLSASPAPGRTPPGPQATGTDPGRQGAAWPGTQRGEGSRAARVRGCGQSEAPRPLGCSGEEMGVIGHVRRAGGAGPPRCGKSLPAPPGRALFSTALDSGGLGGATRGGGAETQALPFLLAEFLLEAPVRRALLTMPEGVDWLSGQERGSAASPFLHNNRHQLLGAAKVPLSPKHQL